LRTKLRRHEQQMISRRILYIQYTDPANYPPLEHSSVLLAKRGWNVLLLGVAATKDGLELPFHPCLRVKRIRLFEGGWRQRLQYIVFFWWALYWTWRWRPQWIYASDPLSCPVVWWIQKFTGVRVVYHEHDSPEPGQAGSRWMNRILAYRGALARRAEVCVLPQQNRLRQFIETTGRKKPTYCVWNCPGLDEMGDTNLAPCRSNQRGELIIYYHGSITPARLPTQLILAASRFKGAVRVRIAGYETLGSKGYIRALSELAANTGVPSVIEPLGAIPHRSDLLRVASSAHVGLSFMPKGPKDINMRHMVGASNKPFDYMGCGLPLLVSNMSEWVLTFVDPGYALACDPDDPNSIEAALRWYLEHPDERRQMGRRGREKIQQAWNYEAMFADVLATLEHH
jgi:glycosyltransferase involved in cell wall biosynthesis